MFFTLFARQSLNSHTFSCTRKILVLLLFMPVNREMFKHGLYFEKLFQTVDQTVHIDLTSQWIVARLWDRSLVSL